MLSTQVPGPAVTLCHSSLCRTLLQCMTDSALDYSAVVALAIDRVLDVPYVLPHEVDAYARPLRYLACDHVEY